MRRRRLFLPCSCFRLSQSLLPRLGWSFLRPLLREGALPAPGNEKGRLGTGERDLSLSVLADLRGSCMAVGQ